MGPIRSGIITVEKYSSFILIFTHNPGILEVPLPARILLSWTKHKRHRTSLQALPPSSGRGSHSAVSKLQVTRASVSQRWVPAPLKTSKMQFIAPSPKC
jgi:hypothetical protein